MEPEILTVSEVAEHLGISRNSVRRYADSLAANLSEAARGRPRLFTEEDVERLHTASQLKASKVGLEAPSLPVGEVQPPNLGASPQPAQKAPLWATMVLNDLNDHAARLRTLEAAQMAQIRAALITGVLAGAAAAWGLCLFLLALAYLLAG